MRATVHYAQCGIPIYVVIDPASAVCTVHSSPRSSGAFADREEVPFGADLVLHLEGREMVIETTGFPRG
ncbi:hypothetical protein QBC98_006798 [Kitasatospora acidiphila]